MDCKQQGGISLEASQGNLIYQTRRELSQDFYDVWLFRADVDITKIVLNKETASCHGK